MFPTATYRLQLHHQFTLQQVKSILHYLQQLGIDTLYASPLFAAVPGSLHGYDVTNPHILNAEIGTEFQLKTIRDQLRHQKMYWLQDIVPNHMAFDPKNEWLMDVLERGQSSDYSSFFDINWNHPDTELSGKILVPFLGEEMEECLKKNEIHVAFGDDGFRIKYFDTAWAYSISAMDVLVSVVQQSSAFDKEELDYFIQGINDLQEQAVSGLNFKEWQTAKEKWLIELDKKPAYKKLLQDAVGKINRDRSLLAEVLDKQFYKLAYWRTTETKINYRRFFLVNGLICLRMEDERAYDHYHEYIKKLCDEGYFNGLRIDHIDGLYEPKAYVEQLRQLVGEESYIIAEKILAPLEDFPSDWDAQGTSGYEFLSHISRLLTHVEGAQQLEEYYKNQIASKKRYEDIVFEKKLFILSHYMMGELNNLISYLHELNLRPSEYLSDDNIISALAVFMAAFPVYRIYPDAFPISQVGYADRALVKAIQKKPEREKELNWIRSLFDSKTSIDEASAELLFLKRMMQFTGPLAAKGVEDTAFYSYNPLISHNEVGDAPGKLAITSSGFHRQMLNRLKKTPFSLNATSTHDTKRGEDARIRINFLSEIPAEWMKVVEQWRMMNMDAKKEVKGKQVPGVNEEYFIYQALIGAFPPDLNLTADDVSRLKEYVQKFLREEKSYTDWTEPDEVYEGACFEFIDYLLDKKNKFLGFFLSFVEKVIAYGSIYSLSQALIKVTAPGIPDIYQGAELWDLSYVDPDNRRPVDYESRKRVLQEIIEKESDHKKFLCFLGNHRMEAYEKIYVLYKSLHFRKNNPDLFLYGEYIPLEIENGDEFALAYARRYNNQWAIVAVPMNISNKMRPHERVPPKEVWNDIGIKLPEQAPHNWKDGLSGQELSGKGLLKLSEVFSEFPVAMLVSGG